ncbi:MAG: hypothetical protein Kapaf2KO_15480 [Candidatus Kapaibacteriales bacterium]
MKNIYISAIISLFVLAFAGFSQTEAQDMPPASKPDKELTEDEATMRINDFQSKVNDLEKQVQEAKSRQQSVQALVDAEKKKFEDCEKMYYSLLNATPADIDAFREALGKIESRVRQMQTLSNDELADRRADVEQLEADLNELRKNKIALIPEIYDKIISLAREIKGLYREKKTTTYTVRPWATSRDCLWNIAERPEILGDANQWPKIWQANRDEIRNPDIIFPGQVLQIPKKGEMDAEAVKLERQYYRNKRESMQAQTGEETSENN